MPYPAETSILAGTFVLDDATTLLTAMGLPADGMTIAVAVAVLYLAIMAGDLTLYGLGRLAATSPWAQRWAPRDRYAHRSEWVRRHIVKLVVVGRFLPGARIPAYTACGYFHVRFGRFALAASIASFVWTSLLLVVGLRLGALVASRGGVWLEGAGFAVTAALAIRVIVWRRAAHP